MTLGKFFKHGSTLTDLMLLEFLYFGSHNRPFVEWESQVFGQRFN